MKLNWGVSVMAGAVLLFFMAACGGSHAPDSPDGTSPLQAGESPSAATPLSAGQTLFLTHCVRCHTDTGNPPGPDATILNSPRLATEDSFRQLLRHPTSGMMKSFSAQELDDATVRILYDYLKTRR
jgi:mono/diheme cytochrome c family protein